MPVCQQNCVCSLVSLHRHSGSRLVIQRYYPWSRSDKGREGVRTSEMKWHIQDEYSRPEAKSWPSKPLNSTLYSGLHLSRFLFGSTAQVTSSENGCFCLELASWTGTGSSVGFAFLGSQCPVLGDNLHHAERGTQGRPPQPPGLCRRVTPSEPWAAPSRLDRFSCSCPRSPSQPQAAKHKEAFLEWDGILGIRREEEWSCTSSLIPVPRFDRKLGQCCFCFCCFLPCQRNHCD